MLCQTNRLVNKIIAQLNPAPRLDDSLCASLCRASLKGVSKRVNAGVAAAIENNNNIVRALFTEAGAQKFAESRGLSLYRCDDADSVFGTLEQATLDKKVMREIDNATQVLDEFQRRMLSLFYVFCELAFTSLTDVDCMRDFYRNHYGAGGKQPTDAENKAREIIQGIATRKAAGCNRDIRDAEADAEAEHEAP